MEKLYAEHEKYIQKFDLKNLRKIALSHSYMNLFVICNDDPFILYGKPIIQLTYNQIQIFEFARTFKNIISNSDKPVPEHVLKDPDKLIEWYESTQEAEKTLNRGAGKRKQHSDSDFQASSLVGASKEDLQNLGYVDDIPRKSVTDKVLLKAKQKGGSLDINDMIQLHGA